MRVAFCTNIRPTPSPVGLRGRNRAIIDRLEESGYDVDVLHGPEPLLRGELPFYGAGILAPNDLVEPIPDPVGRMRAETVALALERRGVPFVNSPLRRRHCTNKLLAHIAFRSAGVSQPRVWTAEELEDAWRTEPAVVVKPVSGSGGLHVALARTPEEAQAHVASVGEPCFIQEYIPAVRCVRVVATREEAIGRYEKRVEPGTLVASIRSGASEIKLPPRGDLDELGVAMIRAVGIDIGGADIVETKEGKLFALEVNVNFGFYAANREILDAIAAQVLLRGGPAT